MSRSVPRAIPAAKEEVAVSEEAGPTSPQVSRCLTGPAEDPESYLAVSALHCPAYRFGLLDAMACVFFRNWRLADDP